MKAYKLEVIIVDHDGINDENEIAGVIENAIYPNDCISPMIIYIKEAEIGEWGDDHPLNSSKTPKEVIEKYFQ